MTDSGDRDVTGSGDHHATDAREQYRTKYAFLGLLALLLVIAVGHLYAFRGLTDLYLGLPLWIWLQLVVVFGMLAIAWFAVQLVANPTEGAA